MAVTVGFYLSGVIAFAIVIIGARFFLALRAAAAGYGVTVRPEQAWNAFLAVKGIRDIASGLLTVIVILDRSAQLLGSFMLVATIIPLTDTAIVIRYGDQGYRLWHPWLDGFVDADYQRTPAARLIRA
jgi:hypothetical protein